MGNKKTPLILQLRKTGGTFYCFPSAAEDVGLNLQTTTSGVALSHYALLNIPKLSIEKCLCDSTVTHATSGNQALAMSLQNYMMNFETKLINEDKYNYQELNTVTEKAFWHWAKKIGIIDENNFSNASTGYDNVYIEKGRDTSTLTKNEGVVKCFGSIDAGNSLSTEFGMYNETYINIPTSYGSGPVYFECSEDENYKLNKTYKSFDITHLEGRGDEYKYYSYTGGQDIPYFDNVNDKEQGEYITAKYFDGITIAKDLQKIQKYVRNQFNDQTLIISSYDDLNIDIDNNFFVDTEFDFNAILLYYSVYDQDDLIKTAYATNLFGIIFLDGVNDESTVNNTPGDTQHYFHIPTLTKRKSTTASFGNSYSFRVNLKTMSVYDNTDAIIQDNTTMSSIASVDFSDVISNLNVAIDTLNNNTQVISKIQDNYAGILAYYDNLNIKVEDISISLNAYLKGAETSYLSTKILYTHEVRPCKSMEENVIRFNTRLSNTKNANGEYDYSDDPTLKIEDDYIEAAKIKNNTLTNKENYIIVDETSDNDSLVLDGNSRNTEDNSGNEIIGIMFKNNLQLKILLKNNKIEESNQLYISNKSEIFDKERTAAENSASHLLDAEGNVNYVGFIPYIIGGMQLIYAKQNESGIHYKDFHMYDPEKDDLIGILDINDNTYQIGVPKYVGEENNMINVDDDYKISLKNYIKEHDAYDFGHDSDVSGLNSFVDGIGNVVSYNGLHASGRYNIDASNAIFMIGDGYKDAEENIYRHNAFEVCKDGSTNIYGNLNVNSIVALDEDLRSSSKCFATDGTILDIGGGGSASLFENVTYNELKSLISGNSLVPGKQYRIIDYECKTSQINTQSANHQFDIIVTADNTNKLNENARAIQHSGDTYFNGCNLAAWELKYCIDNNPKYKWAVYPDKKIYTDDELWFNYTNSVIIDGTTWYLWYNDEFSADEGETHGYLATRMEIPDEGDEAALISLDNLTIIHEDYSFVSQYSESTESGKGVIYYMKDEFNNETPYDARNILFLHAGTYVYTFDVFSNNEHKDAYIKVVNDLNLNNKLYGNIINANKKGLNHIIFLNELNFECCKNKFGFDCEQIKCGNNCCNITCGNNCSYWYTGNNSNILSYVKNILIDDGCKYFKLYSDSTTTSSNYIQNVHIRLGVIGTDTDYKEIKVETNKNYCTEILSNDAITILV